MKGQVQDTILIVVILFATGVSLMIGYMLLNEIGQDPNLSAIDEIDEALTQGKASMVVFGNAFIFIIIAFGLASTISAFYTETHPVFFVFSLLLFAITFLVCWIFSEVFLELAGSGALLPVAAEFVTMIQVMQNMPIIVVLVCGLIIMALYFKRADFTNIGGGQA